MHQGDGGDPIVPLIDEAELASHAPGIRRYLAKVLRRDEVADGVQTVLTRALEARDRFRGESSPRLWMLGIARNVGLEIIRTRQLERRVSYDPQSADATGDIAPECADLSQEDLLGRKEQQALALLALDGLALDDKLALLVTYVDGLSGPAAAEILGVSSAAFRQRLSRARLAIAKRLQELERENAPGSAEVMAQWRVLLDPAAGRPSHDVRT